MASIPEKMPDLISRTLDDGAVIVSPDEGTVKVLNQVGSLIWSSIDGNRTIAQIGQIVVEEFDVTIEQAQDDIRMFVQDLCAKRLLRLSNTNT